MSAGSGGNFACPSGDYPGMNCQHCRDALSARLDDEEAGLASVAIDHHVAHCGACRAWWERAVALNRSVRIGPAHVVPDLSGPILAAAAAEREALAETSRPWRLPWRVGLVVVALAQLALALPGLVLGGHGEEAAHLANELLSFDIALASGFVFAAVRPVRAWGMVPIVAVLVALLALTSSIDLIEGRASALREVTHLLEAVGLGFLWALARPTRRPSPVLRLA